MLLYLTCLAWIFGIFILSGLTFLSPIYFVLAYGVLLWALLASARSSRDWLNPLVLVLVAGFIRFSIVGFMTWMGMDSRVLIFDLMGIRSDEWMMGHVLALMGLLGAVTGWHMNLRLPSSVVQKVEKLTRLDSPGLPLAAVVCMVIGLVALYLFISSNASFEEALYSGEMRGTEIQSGTGKYYRVSLLLIASSVLFSTYLANSGYVWWMALVPSAVAMGAFAILGGRTLALVPMAAAWLALWSRKNTPEGSMKIAVVAGLALLPVYSFLGPVYRGAEGGIAAVTAQAFSFPSVIQYLEHSLWIDWGNLHAMAASVIIGPGVLGGITFTALLWPLPKIFSWPGRSAGVFMVDTLLPYFSQGTRGKWGFHATLIGDAYLNFGAVGVVVATIIFGMLLRIMYGQIRERLSNTAFYGLAAVCSLQIFYISIDQMPDLYLIVGFAFFVVQLARFFEIPSLAPRRAASGASAGERR